jgi:hypothetical protein
VRWTDRVASKTRAHLPILRRCRPELLSCRLPEGVEGDDGFISELDDVVTHSRGFDRNLGFRCRVVKSRTRRLPGVESALLALSLRKASRHDRRENPQDPLAGPMRQPLMGAHESSLTGLPCYGDVEVEADRRTPITLGPIHFGWRWIVPPRYCPLPRR